MMKTTLSTISLIMLLSCLNATAAINRTSERYIEQRQVEVLLHPDNSGGTLLVRPADCSECTSESYRFDNTLRVIYKNRTLPITALARWSHFRADIVVSKDSGQLNAVKRLK